MLHTLSYWILENASKSLHALQNQCSMEVFRKLFHALFKKSIQFFWNIQNFLLVYVITFTNKFFLKAKSNFIGSKKTVLWNIQKIQINQMYILIQFFQPERTWRVPFYVSAAQKYKNVYCKSFDAFLNRTCQLLNYHLPCRKRKSKPSLFTQPNESIYQLYWSNNVQIRGEHVLHVLERFKNLEFHSDSSQIFGTVVKIVLVSRRTF